MDKESKALTIFTVGPLGFYECERMPFGLMNTLATFQCLLESCLGELHLNWCIIYLDDIIVFSKTCLLYTSPSPRDATLSRMPSSA